MYACMQLLGMRTTMAMDSALRDRLMGLKATWNAPSLEAVVQRLVDGTPATALALRLQDALDLEDRRGRRVGAQVEGHGHTTFRGSTYMWCMVRLVTSFRPRRAGSGTRST